MSKEDYFMLNGIMITLEPEQIIIEYIYFLSFVNIMAPLAYTTLIAGNET